MKKLFILFLTGFMLFSLCSCAERLGREDGLRLNIKIQNPNGAADGCTLVVEQQSLIQPFLVGGVEDMWEKGSRWLIKIPQAALESGVELNLDIGGKK